MHILKNKLNPLSATLFAIPVLIAVFLLLPTKVSALSGSQFDAGNIISDSVFFNGTSMSVYDVQNFLNAKVPNCDTWGTQPYGGTTRAAYASSKGVGTPFTCLKSYTQSVPSVSGNEYCGGGIAGGNKSSAGIIYDVAQACNVSPKVLLVLLQKEQSLVTDDWPWPVQYRSATGYGCPDTAPCDAEYYGFFNQVYQAAKAYNRYKINAANYNYRSGRNNTVLWNPNAGCGSSSVYIQNQATAGLYIYTPYRPNQAALDNLYGTGDGCSSYGNRNFWRMFNDWFGSTRQDIPWGWTPVSTEVFADPQRTVKFTDKPTVTPGGYVYVRIKAQNSGTKIWQKGFLNIGTQNPQDHNSQFSNTGWLNGARPAHMVENTVDIGQTATFEFAMKAPNQSGSYRDVFRGVADGYSWLAGSNLDIKFNVVTTSNGIVQNKNFMNSGMSLNIGDYLISNDGNSTLSLTRNGNLNLDIGFKSKWSSLSANMQANKLILQGDGNLVLYTQNMRPVWATGTDGNPGAWLALQEDGNLVLYSSSNSPLWSTGTSHIPLLSAYTFNNVAGGCMLPGQMLSVPNRNYKLILQGDGNLVLYTQNMRPVWATGTDGKSAYMACMQGDGNLVLYTQNMRPVWATGTDGNMGATLYLQEDRNLVIYTPSMRPIWNTRTYQ